VEFWEPAAGWGRRIVTGWVGTNASTPLAETQGVSLAAESRPGAADGEAESLRPAPAGMRLEG